MANIISVINKLINVLTVNFRNFFYKEEKNEEKIHPYVRVRRGDRRTASNQK